MKLPSAHEWRTISAQLDALLDASPHARALQLQSLRVSNPALADQLATLLAAHEDASRDGFLTGTATAPPVSGGSAGLRCGPYTLDSLIGRGGMGSVWRAHRHDGRYDATVAVKLLNSALLDAQSERRFVREGEILARLEHPNIARLLDAGVGEDGQPFLVLALVDGAPIDTHCDANRLDLRARVRLFGAVCDAVAHAHAKLIVHRDLKPSNILVDGDGAVKLLDFGIAKLLEEGSDSRPAATALTRDGGRLLTPNYAAPEQVAGGDITTATDVYALGVLLCELLTGKRPYRLARESAGALEDAILTGDLHRPSEQSDDPARQRKLRGDLDTIVLKALRQQPADRYATVRALADDLERWLDGRPVLAQPATLRYRTTRFVQRHAVAVGASALVLVAIVGGAGVALWQGSVARAEQQRAEQVTAFISDIFANADPYQGEGSTLDATDLLVQAKARLDASLAGEPETRLELLLLIAGSLANLQAFAAAEPMAEEAQALARAAHGELHASTLRADIIAADVQRFRGRLDAMDSTVQRTLTALRQIAAPDSSMLVSTLENSAHVAIDRGRPEEAVAPAREALRVAEAYFPTGHDEIVSAAQVLAVSMQNREVSSSDALAAAEYANTLTQTRFAATPNHPRMVEAMMLLGRALGNAGKPREAIRVHEDAAVAAASGRGEENFMRAFIFGNGARYRSELGDYAAALGDYDSALVILASVGDTIGASYGITLSNRGDQLLRLERFAEALGTYGEASILLATLWGDDHPRVLQMQLRSAHATAGLGRVAAASEMLRQLNARDMPESLAGQVAFVNGVVARRANRAPDAVTFQTAALRTLPDSTAPAEARQRAPVLLELGLAYKAMGDAAQAATAFRSAVAAFRLGEMERTAEEVRAEAELARLGR